MAAARGQPVDALRRRHTRRPRSATGVGDLTNDLAGDIQSDYEPLVSGQHRHVHHRLGLGGQAGRRRLYSRGAAQPEHDGRRVAAGRHAQRLRHRGRQQPLRHLTENTITGLGMAATPDRRRRSAQPGGISNTELESVNIYLGKGKQHAPRRRAPARRRNTIDTGAGNDTVYVRDDLRTHHDRDRRRSRKVDVSERRRGRADRRPAHRRHGGDTGDTLLINDSADTSDSTGTLTGTTLNGLGCRPSPRQRC